MNRDSYATPPEVFLPLHAEFNFAVDVCASAENTLLQHFITERENCLTADWCRYSGQLESTGWYAWMNPPYSDIGPFVKRAAEMAAKGIGTVMLVMMDQSVGWYKEAIKTCQEVRLVIGGRLSFIDPSTGKPAAGNNKGSMFIIWHPFGRTPVQYSHIERDEMLAAGRALLEQAEPGEQLSNPCQLPEPDLPNDALQLPAEPEQKHNWPVEALEIVEQALDQHPCEPTDSFYQELCEEANRQLLNGYKKSSIVDDLVTHLLQEDAA